MQGQRSAIGSLPESINFDYGSTSSNMGIDQQICWNNLQEPAESRFSEYRIAPGGTDSIMSTVSHEARNLSSWSIGEPSSSNHQNPINHDERMTQNGWSSSMSASTGARPRLEDQTYDPTIDFSRNGINLNLCGSVSQSHDINGGQLGRVGADLMDCSNSSKSSASSSGSGGFLVEEDDGRPGYSLDGRRLSCKRKTIEGNAGQSSNSGSSSLTICPQLETSLGVSAPEPVNPRFRLSMSGVAPDSIHAHSVSIGAESSRGSYRLRTNPMIQQDNSSVLPRAPVGHSDAPAGHQPVRFMPVNPPLDLIPPIQPENVLRLPGPRRNIPRARWCTASSSRAGSSSAPLHEDLNSRPIPRNISEHPLFMPSVEVRNTSAHNPTGWNLNDVGLGASRHAGSGSRAGSGSSSQSSARPTWRSHRQTSSQYSRGLSEYVRRSLLSSAGSESGSNPVHRTASASQEVVLPSAGGARGQNAPFARSALWIDRHGDGVVGIPHSLRAFAAAGEGRSRLVSEQIRNVLDIMRRGEGLRFEDVMILDPSVFFGMADIHDQHRDMRLDVDNMSYEELLALEERIGNVCTGLTEETVLTRMKQRKYFSVTRDDQTEMEPCCICQEEYNDGEGMGTLDCGHDFHTDCIKQWLAQKNLCPICKTTGLAT